jgi:hypothetical protein
MHINAYVGTTGAILIITGVVTVFGQSDEIKPDPTRCFQNGCKDVRKE